LAHPGWAGEKKAFLNILKGKFSTILQSSFLCASSRATVFS